MNKFIEGFIAMILTCLVLIILVGLWAGGGYLLCEGIFKLGFDDPIYTIAFIIYTILFLATYFGLLNLLNSESDDENGGR